MPKDPGAIVISTGPIPGSQKVYVEHGDLRIPFRQLLWKNWPMNRRSASTIRAARIPMPISHPPSMKGCRACVKNGFARAAMSKNMMAVRSGRKTTIAKPATRMHFRISLIYASRSGPKPAAMSARCIMRGAASSRRKWNMSPSREPRPRDCGYGDGETFGANIPGIRNAGVRSQRNR